MSNCSVNLKRYPNNPILGPDKGNPWEARAVFNGCPVRNENGYHLFYRALSAPMYHRDTTMELSTIGYAHSDDGLNFSTERRQLIFPQESWEAYGCEDPRVTKIDDTYYIFYTALADYPHTPAGITVGVAMTKDLRKIDERHHVTHFNSKAMALFPEKVDGKYCAILTVDTDTSPVRIAIAKFDNIEQIWDRGYWEAWYNEIDKHTLHLQRDLDDHIEIGAPPVKVDDGWLLVYSYIRNYRSGNPVFGVETALLDAQNPIDVIGRNAQTLIQPEEVYERYGMVANITFPSGVLIDGDRGRLYYGAADTVCAVAEFSLSEVIDCLAQNDVLDNEAEIRLHRFEGNPIIEPNSKNAWESKYTLNPTAFLDNGNVHILYRAQDQNDTSVIGLATSMDGLHISEQLNSPIYVPRIAEEVRLEPGFSGCEDARATVFGERLYICYTAYNGHGPARVAMSWIDLADFRAQNWDAWSLPKLISPEGIDDKNACLLPEKVGGKHVFFHRLKGVIWVDFVDSLDFADNYKLGGNVIMSTRPDKWDSLKIGIAGVPIRVGDNEWLLIYHALSAHDGQYRLGAAILDLTEGKVLSRLDYPILEPRADYENRGLRPGTVFSCGSVVVDDELFMYYGGADQIVAVATANFQHLVDTLREKNKA